MRRATYAVLDTADSLSLPCRAATTWSCNGMPQVVVYHWHGEFLQGNGPVPLMAAGHASWTCERRTSSMSLPHLIPDTHDCAHPQNPPAPHLPAPIQALAGDLTAKPCSTHQGLKCVPSGPPPQSAPARQSHRGANMAPAVAGCSVAVTIRTAAQCCLALNQNNQL